jgi:hypothetical protein
MPIYFPHRVGVGKAPVAVHDEGYMLGDVPGQKQPNQPAHTVASRQHDVTAVQRCWLFMDGEGCAAEGLDDRWRSVQRSAAASAGARAWEAYDSVIAHIQLAHRQLFVNEVVKQNCTGVHTAVGVCSLHACACTLHAPPDALPSNYVMSLLLKTLAFH